MGLLLGMRRVRICAVQASTLSKLRPTGYPVYNLLEKRRSSSQISSFNITKYVARDKPPHDPPISPDAASPPPSTAEHNAADDRHAFSPSRKFTVSQSVPLLSGSHVVYVALGSNLGNRFEMIEYACREMDSQGIKITRTSSLYETEPMYLEDQAPFINGVCEVSHIPCLYLSTT